MPIQGNSSGRQKQSPPELLQEATDHIGEQGLGMPPVQGQSRGIGPSSGGASFQAPLDLGVVTRNQCCRYEPSPQSSLRECSLIRGLSAGPKLSPFSALRSRGLSLGVASEASTDGNENNLREGGLKSPSTF